MRNPYPRLGHRKREPQIGGWAAAISPRPPRESMMKLWELRVPYFRALIAERGDLKTLKGRMQITHRV